MLSCQGGKKNPKRAKLDLSDEEECGEEESDEVNILNIYILLKYFIYLYIFV